ncbi:GNAT family N-acetyltransferase [Flammeovirga yaeyamensis]|uniref:GNAT family N-acetyltransferase n=1 Tax=Flammeovirga yaeyamensis TaxID=367791 RepID=A0AAX1N773_9BACT|nr:GNAT family N-acetyltransferase [Flammeovirga yaeyamensis]MBB3701074.1 ribosomal protein S18 acetylase RimI-like enzyme [Flammeovirga yaeyamensis]NMF38095.1 GNAT family N-acetyltransferase [Flammeovirga yaeyamensis]QWG01867.1 GNAT family N-acetyltransferase [Flammeovirga yaeyamensis]
MGYITIKVKTTYLELKNNLVTQYTFPFEVDVLPWQPKDTQEYLKVYKAVGDAWGWTGSTLLDEETLSRRIHSPSRIFYLLKVSDEVAGFIEFVLDDKKEVEILYFGLTPNFIGKKLGLPFLSTTIDKVIQLYDIKKVWLHTCEYDHPSAIKNYKKVGFEVIKEELVEEPYDEDYLEEFKKKYHG